jgi:hypothetical protein
MQPNLTASALHIHCGDCSERQLRASGVPGVVRVIHDPVCCGPTPEGVTGEDGYRLRAQYRSRQCGTDWAESRTNA